MPTLPSDQIIPDGVAKRLAVRFALQGLAQRGEIGHGDLYFVRNCACPVNERDPQGFEADRRALSDYLSHHGPRPPVEGWENLWLDDSVVPWSYLR